MENQCFIMETYGNLWKPMEIYGNLWKSMEIYGNLWKSMEIYGYPLVNVYKKLWKDSPFLMGKSTISMAMFNSYLYVYQRVKYAKPPEKVGEIAPDHGKQHQKKHQFLPDLWPHLLGFPAGCAPSKRIVVTALVWSELDRVNLNRGKKICKNNSSRGFWRVKPPNFWGFLDVTDVTNWQFLGFQK